MEKYFLMAIDKDHASAMYNLGMYHSNITKNYVEMEKYYLMAIELGNTSAMYNLGMYHSNITKNYAEMEKYYLMAIELGNTSAMCNLGMYHYDITKNYAEMEKYFLMAIDKDHASAMCNLGMYHNNITKNYAEMEKYYLMAIELESTSAIYNLGLYHQQITKNYAEMEKYYLMAIELGYENAMIQLKNHHDNDPIELFGSFDGHFDSKPDHTDAFLDEHCKLLKNDEIQTHIQNMINSSCQITDNVVNKHLYEKYIQTGERVETGAYATNFTIVATLTGSELTKTYHVHSHVLNSEYFLNLIDSGFMEASSVSMEVTDFAVMDILLKYLYTNEWTKLKTKEHCENLRQIADEFGFDALTTMCAWTAKLNGLYR
jgi:TPR repeat protein